MRNSCMVSSVVVVAFELADGEQQQQQQCRVASRRRSNCARPLVCVCANRCVPPLLSVLPFVRMLQCSSTSFVWS